MVSHGMDGVLVGGLGMGLSLVSDISNEAILVVSVVGHNLHSAVRKLDSVLSLDNSVLILTLCLGEVSAVFVSSSWQLLGSVSLSPFRVKTHHTNRFLLKL